jgi:hypothetical protein
MRRTNSRRVGFRIGLGLLFPVFFCVALALRSAAGGGQAQSSVQTVAPHVQVQKKMHRLFVPRTKIRLQGLRAAGRAQTRQSPLPPSTSFKPRLPQVKRLTDHWRRVAYVPTAGERIRQALRAPRESEMFRPRIRGDIWTPVGSGIHDADRRYHQGGRVRTMAYGFDNDVGHDVLWVGASSGGLWKSIAGPLGSWRPMSDSLPGSPSVGAFLVHAGDSRRILIGTGDYGRYPGNGMFRTADGGANWSEIPLAGSPLIFYRILADRMDRTGDTVLACGSDGPAGAGGVWKSVDFGQTWRRVLSAQVTDLAQDPSSPGYWWAAARERGIYESRDGGESFHLISGTGGTGLTTPIGRISIAVCESAPNYLYALIERDSAVGGVFRSADYGMSWTQIESQDEISWGQGFHTCAIGVHPDDPNKLLVGMGGLQRTDNATAATVTWRRGIDGGHADYTGFLFHPPTGNVLISNDGGCTIYTWSSGQITGELNLGLACQQVMSSNGFLASDWSGANLIAGLQDNGMVLIKPGREPVLTARRGGDGGQASLSEGFPIAYYFSSGCAYNRFLAQDAGDLTNINGALGTEWTPTVLIDPAGRRVVFTNTNDSVWQRPADGGTWAKVNRGHAFPAGFNCKQIDVAPDPDRWVIYATAWTRGRLLVIDSDSLDHAEWVDRTPPLPAGSSSTDALVNAEQWHSDRGVVFYTTSVSRPSRAFMSEDYGRTWHDVTGNLADLVPDASFWKLMRHPEKRDRLYLATDVGVYCSTNAGAHWVRFMDGLPEVVNVMDMILVSQETAPPPTIIGADGRATPAPRRMVPPFRIIIGTYGRGFWSRPLLW